MKKKILVISTLIINSFLINVQALSINETTSNTVIVGNVETPVYNIETIWGEMEFTYVEQINYIWNDETHEYTKGTNTNKWISEENYVDINNKSNQSINVEMSYTKTNSNITGTFDISKATIEPNSKERFTLVLGGKLENNNTEYQKIGFIYYKIS